jgi:hypothetical protein
MTVAEFARRLQSSPTALCERLACVVEIGDQVFLKVVVARHRMAFAALLAQPHP